MSSSNIKIFIYALILFLASIAFEKIKNTKIRVILIIIFAIAVGVAYYYLNTFGMQN